MANDNETIANIVAEMRKLGKLDEKSTDKIPRSLMGLGFRTYADRIESAEKRKSEPVTNCNRFGNAAAMREALEAMNRIDTRGLKRLLCELVEADIFDGGQINKTISAVEKAWRALAAPAKNCDLYKDAPSAYADFIVPWKLDGHMDDVPTLQDFADWLFAPAAERKGEDK